MRLLLVPVALLALAVAPAGAAEPGATADEQAVMAADQAFYEASREKHGQAWADFADENATLPAGHGKPEIGAFYDKLYARPGFALSWRPTYAKVVGDLGITSGPYEAHRQDAEGQDRPSTGSYVTVWQRQNDGTWRFVWDGGTQDNDK
jgi:ketosteroid isomerase-like protein